MNEIQAFYEPINQLVTEIREGHKNGGVFIPMYDFNHGLARDVSANIVHVLGQGSDPHVFLSFMAGYYGSSAATNHKIGMYDMWWEASIPEMAVAIGWTMNRVQRALKKARDVGWVISYRNGRNPSVHCLQGMMIVDKKTW